MRGLGQGVGDNHMASRIGGFAVAGYAGHVEARGGALRAATTVVYLGPRCWVDSVVVAVLASVARGLESVSQKVGNGSLFARRDLGHKHSRDFAQGALLSLVDAMRKSGRIAVNRGDFMAWVAGDLLDRNAEGVCLVGDRLTHEQAQAAMDAGETIELMAGGRVVSLMSLGEDGYVERACEPEEARLDERST